MVAVSVKARESGIGRECTIEMSKVIAALAAVEQVEAVRLAAAGGLPTRYAYGELWDRRGMDLQVTLLRIFSPFLPVSPNCVPQI